MFISYIEHNDMLDEARVKKNLLNEILLGLLWNLCISGRERVLKVINVGVSPILLRQLVGERSKKLNVEKNTFKSFWL